MFDKQKSRSTKDRSSEADNDSSCLANTNRYNGLFGGFQKYPLDLIVKIDC